MKGFKGYVGFVALALCSANVCADLPQSSILSRYGVTTDQLPNPPKSETVEPVEEKSRFQIQPEQPFVTLRLGDGKQPQTTGNLSIDRMAQQDLERCRRLQGEVVKRGGTYMPCDGSIPGMPTFE
ncbi:MULTISPECIES: hypothetical protein [Pseudomonas]|uniref:Uncharacterized protein n=2 Tax=Pseudomonas TaxID=286 RepID=A0A4R7UXU1_9PSED|nr:MULTISPECIES: hypothetical protein [Pseudomonas]TDV41659.1 hypothetical protein EDF87_116111 [Pseudomonas helmanticensis]VVP86534.1 hypothetical protein PS941_01254 [Pseudomonas fluorescens]